MTGFVYRMAMRMKDAGERLRWDWLTRIGLALREVALRGTFR